MIISLFGEVVVKPDKEADEARLTDKLSPILRSIPGFISSKNYRADDGGGDRCHPDGLAGSARRLG
jgi:antibiotic biosynthesis monooxygenase (ABM) superfamily enzyme